MKHLPPFGASSLASVTHKTKQKPRRIAIRSIRAQAQPEHQQKQQALVE
jgi:hypothetical protein